MVSTGESHVESLKENADKGVDLVYAINDRPPWYLCILLSFQVNAVMGPEWWRDVIMSLSLVISYAFIYFFNQRTPTDEALFCVVVKLN